MTWTFTPPGSCRDNRYVDEDYVEPDYVEGPWGVAPLVSCRDAAHSWGVSAVSCRDDATAISPVYGGAGLAEFDALGASGYAASGAGWILPVMETCP